jgi:uncharacterized protein YegL
MFLLLTLLLLWILAGLVVFWLGTQTPGPKTKRLVRTCGRRLGYVNAPVSVRLWLSGQGMPADEVKTEQSCVVHVLDLSSSMGSGPGSALDQAVNAAASFVKNLVSENCKAGIVTFDDEARIVAPITSSQDVLIRALHGLRLGKGTNLSGGLTQARAALEATFLGASVKRIIILFSDGAGDADAARQTARELKESGVRIVAVAVGAYADENLLREMASNDRDYYPSLAASSLERLYETAGTSRTSVCGYRARVEEFVATDGFLLSATGTPEPFESNYSEGRIKWFIPFVQSSALDIPYEITPLQAGWKRIAQRSASVAMVDGNGVAVRSSSNSSPHMLVLPSGWWPGLALLFNPLFWMIWNLLRGKWKSYELVPAQARLPAQLPKASQVRPLLETTTPDTLKPALIIGVGYAGSLVLRALRYQLSQLQPPPSGMLRFLWIDTGPNSPDDFQGSGVFGDPIPEEDRILMPANVQPVFQDLRNAKSPPAHFAWLDVERNRRSLVAQDYDLSRGTQRRRVLGRVALYKHLDAAPGDLAVAIDERLISLGQHCRIFVTGHMGGGTASGMLVDLCVLLQKRIQQLQHEVNSVDALLFTPRILDSGTLDPALLRNALALSIELSRLTIRRHLPVAVAQTAVEATSPTEVKNLLDSVLLLEHPLEPPVHRKQWPGPATHSAAELLLHLLLEQKTAKFLDDQMGECRRLERLTGHSVVCAAGATARWLPILEIRRLLTAHTILDFLSREFLRLERVGNTLTPIRDSETQRLAQENAVAFLAGSGSMRSQPYLIGSLAALADRSTSPAELGRIMSQMRTYPGTKDRISSEVGGSGFLAEVLNAQEESFAAALEEWSLAILNGLSQPDSFDSSLRRGAFSRLTLAVEHLISLSDACLRNLDDQRDTAIKRGDEHRFDFIRYLFGRYRGVLSGFQRHLSTWLTVLLHLVNQMEGEVSAVRRQLQTLCDELQPYVIWSDELNDRFVTRYVDPVRAQVLERVNWKPEIVPNGSVRLTLCVQGQEVFCFPSGPDAVPSLRHSLAQLIPLLELDCGLELHRENVANYVDLKRWLQSDWNDPVNFDNNLQATLSGTPIVRKNIAFLSSEEESVTGVADTVQTNHAYRASVLRLISECALFSAAALHDYERNFPNERHADLPFLDPIDRLAAAYEDQFTEVGLVAPMLCPAIRAYFVDHELLRAFVLAHALGLLFSRMEADHEVLFLNEVPLTHERISVGYPLLLEAMDNFIILKRSASHEPINRGTMLKTVNLKLQAQDAESLRQIVRSGSSDSARYLTTCPPVVRSDFVQLVELFVDLELQRRQEMGSVLAK